MEAGPRCEFVFKGIKTGCHAKCVLGERQFRIISQNIFIEKKINFVFCVKGEVVKKKTAGDRSKNPRNLEKVWYFLSFGVCFVFLECFSYCMVLFSIWFWVGSDPKILGHPV